MQRRGPICSCTAGSLQARLIPRWFRPYSVHRVPRWKGVPLSEYIPIKKSELRYTRLCPRALYTLHPAPCTFYPLVQLFSFPFSNLLSFPAYPSFSWDPSLPPPQPTSSHPTPFTSAFCLPPTEPRSLFATAVQSAILASLTFFHSPSLHQFLHSNYSAAFFLKN